MRASLRQGALGAIARAPAPEGSPAVTGSRAYRRARAAAQRVAFTPLPYLSSHRAPGNRADFRAWLSRSRKEYRRGAWVVRVGLGVRRMARAGGMPWVSRG